MESKADKKHEDKIADHELRQIEAIAPIRAPAVFEAIRREGQAELERPTSALALSGLIAGLALGFSVLTEALLRKHLPDAPWRPLVENIGYTVGFMIVILGQMQLFTENTITAVCPVLDDPGRRMLGRLAKLWSVVLAMNLIGASAFGYALYATRVFDPDLWIAVEALSRHATSYGFGETVVRAVAAGWLIAALVWVLPNSENSQLSLIVIVTYLIALGDFSHVVAGTTEVSTLVFSGEVGLGAALRGFILPALIGNVLGGTVFFTVLTYGQIRVELSQKRNR